MPAGNIPQRACIEWADSYGEYAGFRSSQSDTNTDLQDSTGCYFVDARNSQT